MSEGNYFGIAVREQMRKDPSVLTIDEEQLRKQIAEGLKATQAIDAKNNKLRAEPVRVQYNKLRKHLFDLQQMAKATETKVNHEVDNTREFERRILDLLEKKKAATEAGHLGQERVLEHQVQLLETELQDARERLIKRQRENTAAAHALRNFDNARLAELKLELKIK